MNENENETRNQDKSYVAVDIASVQDVPNDKMKHVEINGKEILIANIDGNYYAISDRCGHSNAPLSRGNLEGNVVTYPLHGAQFDVITGRKEGFQFTCTIIRQTS
jgi:nitrite reductase/ring-hydroxylating ferredoxin subunit